MHHLRDLRASELRLLAERTRIRKRQESLLRRSEWSHGEAEELERESARVEAELKELREHMSSLERT